MEENRSLEDELRAREVDLEEKKEELESQRGMLNAAIEELVDRNKELIQTLDKLKERNDELEKLLYHTSHGLKSPLTSIQGILNLFGKEVLSNNQKEYLDHINRKSLHMISIMNSLATLSKLSDYESSTKQVNIESSIAKIIKSFDYLIVENQVDIIYEMDDTIRSITTDSFLLETLLAEIIMNGLVFRPRRKGFLKITTHTTDKKLILSIEDDGDGIDPTIQASIYQMFFRGSEKTGGSGLGLFIAQQAVGLLNGKIDFTHKPVGSIFNIEIPS